MDARIRKVDIQDVRVGMHVSDVFSSKGTLLFSANIPITSKNQIEKLRAQGVTAVYIDVDKSSDTDTPNPPMTGAQQPPDLHDFAIADFSRYGRELRRAERDYHSTIDAARAVMASARMGRMFAIPPLECAAALVVESIRLDPGLMLTIAQIRQFTPDIHAHSVNVCVMVSALCHALGWSEDEILAAGIGGMLHDVGMMRMPQQLLTKNGRFSRQEQELMKRHPEYGIDLMEKRHDIPERARDLIGHHHERLNGKGYPSGAKGTGIPEIALIAAIADVYDALTTAKAYRPAFLPQEALALIFQASDEEFPRTVVEHFTKLLGIYPVGSFVKLDSGEMGVVIRSNRQRLLEPVVMVLFDDHGRKLDAPRVRDVAAWNDATEQRKRQRIDASINPERFGIDPGKLVQKSLISAA